MADMIEIMARAIRPHAFLPGKEPWRKRSRRLAFVKARRVRDAIRNPTPAMTTAGATVPIPLSTPNEEASRLVYQANIDAMETESAGDG